VIGLKLSPPPLPLGLGLARSAGEGAVFGGGLLVVAGLAHGLPVGSVPEEHHVSPVRDLVVHDRGGCHSLAACIAVRALAQRVVTQEGLSRPLPCVCVAALVSRAALAVQLLCFGSGVLDASACAIAHESAAAWVGARARRGGWHGVGLQRLDSNQRPPIGQAIGELPAALRCKENTRRACAGRVWSTGRSVEGHFLHFA